MDKLEAKLLELKELLEKSMNNIGVGGAGKIKAGAVLPSINKLPKPGHVSVAGAVKIPGQAAAPKKNPLNVAEQTHNKDIKDIRMKEAQAELAMKKNDEVTFAKNGQWSLDKSGYKGYTPEDNARRKAGNLPETTGVHSMDAIKKYGGSGPSAAAKEAKQMKAKSKKMPVKEYSKEEIDAMNKPVEKTEGRTTAAPGVSEMGIETRRADPKSQAYARVATPAKHAETAKEIARANIKQTQSIKPKLPK